MAVLPYKEQDSGKKEQVAQMFNNISGKYDFLNHLLSAGIDIRWRKKAINLLRAENPKKILDVATGTGDFAIESLSLNPDKVIGVDISAGMLEVGRQKMERLGYSDKIEMQLGDSEKLNFPDNEFDAVIVSFGVRNFENLEKGLSDMFRVLKQGGTVVIVEFSQPESPIFRGIYNFYFKYILPVIGRLVSKDTAAYTYLPESVQQFPYGIEFLRILEKVGFKNTKCKPLTFGISSIYVGKKPAS